MTTKKAPIVHLTQKDGYLWLTAPYNPEANNRYKLLEGKWVPDAKVWRFNLVNRDAVLSLVKDIFGVEVTVGAEGYAYATKGTEYFGKGIFRRPRPITVEEEKTLGDGLTATLTREGLVLETEQTTFEKAQMIAANLAVHMLSLTEKEKEELFKIAFGDE